jgi:glutamate mutase epsilon subunit
LPEYYTAQFVASASIADEIFSVDKACHERMVKLVEQMLPLHKQLAAAEIPDEKNRILCQIETTDEQIDQLIYELYGLTEKEAQILEKAP